MTPCSMIVVSHIDILDDKCDHCYETGGGAYCRGTNINKLITIFTGSPIFVALVPKLSK